MGPATARRVSGLIVGIVVTGVLVGVTGVVVHAGRDLNQGREPLCPRPTISGPGRMVIPIGGAAISASGSDGSLWVMRESDAGLLSLVHIDTGTNAILGEPIPLPNGAAGFAVLHGDLWVAVAPSTTGNQPTPIGSVLRINAATGRVVTAVAVGRSPYGVAAGFGFVWVVNSADGTVSKIDPGSNRVVAIVAAGWAPLQAAAGNGSVWVATRGQDQSTLRIDPHTDRVVTTIPGFHVQSIDRGIVWGSGAVAPNGGIVKVDEATSRIASVSYATDIAPATVVAHDGRVWVGKWFFYCRQHYPMPEGPPLIVFELFQLDPATMKPMTKPFPIAFGPVTPVYADGALWVADPSAGGVLRIDLDLAFRN